MSSSKHALEDSTLAPNDRKVRKVKEKEDSSASLIADIAITHQEQCEVPQLVPLVRHDPRFHLYRIEASCGKASKKWTAYEDESVVCTYLSGATSCIVSIKSDWAGQSYRTKYRVDFPLRQQQNIETGHKGFGRIRPIRILGPPGFQEIVPASDHHHIATDHEHVATANPTIYA